MQPLEASTTPAVLVAVEYWVQPLRNLCQKQETHVRKGTNLCFNEVRDEAFT